MNPLDRERDIPYKPLRDHSTLVCQLTLWDTAQRAREKKETERLPAKRGRAGIEGEPEISGRPSRSFSGNGLTSNEPVCRS